MLPLPSYPCCSIDSYNRNFFCAPAAAALVMLAFVCLLRYTLPLYACSGTPCLCMLAQVHLAFVCLLRYTLAADFGPVGAIPGEPPPGHITNAAQNSNADVWSLQQLAAHMGQEAFRRVWLQLLRSCALTVGAGLGDMLEQLGRYGAASSR
jgi:hypothetical protein